MQIVSDSADFLAAYRETTARAQTLFGDNRVYVERYVERPRHVEVQVLGDNYGSIVHLGERECSIQRRHQKIIEEAPGNAIDAHLRRELGEAGVAGALLG